MLLNAFATQSCLGLLGALLDRQVGHRVAVWVEAGFWEQENLQARSLRNRADKEDVSSRAVILEDSYHSACAQGTLPLPSSAQAEKRTSPNEEWQDWETLWACSVNPPPHKVVTGYLKEATRPHACHRYVLPAASDSRSR